MERRSPPRGCAGSAHRGPDPASGREASGRCGSPRIRRRTLASDSLLSAVLSRVVPLGVARLVPRLNLPVRSPDGQCRRRNNASCSVTHVPGRRKGSLMDGRGAWQPTRRELLRAAAAAGAGIALPGSLARGALAARSASYDDGTASIPGGLDGEPERVIIVGAGWAGLTAANALRNAGVEHVVLEGRDRIGGRAHTVDRDGAPG